MATKLALGIKQGMTQVFDEKGRVFPATVLNAGPMTVTQIKTKEKDGYCALQIGFSEAKEKHVSKAVQGHLKGAGKLFRHISEIRRDDIGADVKVGDSFTVGDLFKVGDVVETSATSKGKGFQGVVKRHGFKGGPRSHGQKHSEREPGSIGGGGRAGGRVAKGMRMAGRMGGDRVTVKNLKVLQVDGEKNILVIGGAIPGRRGALVEIRG